MKIRWALFLACIGAVALLAACGGSPGQRACDYFRDDYYTKYLRELPHVDDHAPVQEETEKVWELAQDAEPEIRAAGTALLAKTTQDYNDPYGDAVSDAHTQMIRACKVHGYWEDLPLE